MVGYNVQVAVDEKHKLIMEHEVTQAVTDQHQLVAMSERAKQTLGAEKLEVVADMGYSTGPKSRMRSRGLGRLHPQTADLSQYHAGPVWQGVLYVQPRTGCICLPRRRNLELSFSDRGEGSQDPLLFNSSLWAARLESPMHAQ